MDNSHLVIALLTALFVGGSSTAAYACSWSEGTEFSGRWETVRMPAAGPLVLEVARYSGPGEEEPFARDELAIEVLDGSGETIPGELELVDARSGQRIYWIPDEPLGDPTYTLEASDAAGTATAELEVVDVEPDLPVPNYELKGVREDRVSAGPEYCCESDSCTTDGCGGVERCESCWHDDVEYVTRVSIDVFIPFDLPTGWIETRQYRVNPDESRTLFRRPDGGPTFSEDAPYPRCVEVALYDRVRDIESATEVCFDESDVEKIERAPVDNDYAKSICTTPPEEVDTDTDDTDTDESDEEPPPGWEFTETGGDPSDSGCCATAASRTSESAWLVIVGMLLTLRARRRP